MINVLYIPITFCFTFLEANSNKKIDNKHHWIVSVMVGVSCTFVISIMLLVCGVHWYRSRLICTSYGIYFLQTNHLSLMIHLFGFFFHKILTIQTFAVQQDYEFNVGHLKRFTFRELQVATGNFSSKNILGQGGFGVVYKGCLINKTLVAVKRLKDPNFSGEVQFQTELEMISLALHRNLLRLYGFCLTSDERLLVYPYMPNGSVADRLRGIYYLT